MVKTVQKPEKPCQRTKASPENSGCGGFFALLALLDWFENDWVAWCGLRMEPLGTSRCFSAWLWGSSRGPQLDQKCWQPPTNLRQGHGAAATLPGTVEGFDQWTCGHQLVVGTGHDLAPAFGLLRSPETRLLPHEHLLIKPKAMFVGV